MPRSTSSFFSTLFTNKKHSSTSSNSSSDDAHSSDERNARRGPKQASGSGRRRRPLTPPTVSARDSSLYRHHHHHHAPFDVTSTPDLLLRANHRPYSTICQSSADLYNLEHNPSVYFPTPPPRSTLESDKRHTAIWDDLFDWAEQHQSFTESSASGTTSFASSAVPSRSSSALKCATQWDLTETVKDDKKKRRLSGLFSLGRLGMRSEIWSKKDTIDMAASTESTLPVVPPRSRLRAQAPPPITSVSSYLLPVDEPLPSTPETPMLSSASSSSQGSPNHLPLSPGFDTASFGQRRKSSAQAALGKDPLKVRDGAEPRRSSSGVYTPPTFPGAQGPRPSHFPSHVYTPANFSLAPPRSTPSNYIYAPAGPSRSASVSSTDSEGPTTPGPTQSRLSSFSGKAMTGLKRLSHQVSSTITPVPVKQPMSARDSYFPSSIGADVSRVYDASTPTTPRGNIYAPPFAHQASTYSLGLAVGLGETDGRTFGTSPTSAMEFGESQVDLSKASPQSRGKRKPVPRILDDTLAARLGGLRVDDAAPHAL